MLYVKNYSFKDSAACFTHQHNHWQMNHTRPSHRDVSSHMVSSDYVIYHDHFTLHSLEHNHGHVSRIGKLFCLRSSSRSAYSCITGAVDRGFWYVSVGNGRGWHSPRHREELTGLRKSCSRGWASAGIWELGFREGSPHSRNQERSMPKLCTQCGFC